MAQKLYRISSPQSLATTDGIDGAARRLHDMLKEALKPRPLLYEFIRFEPNELTAAARGMSTPLSANTEPAAPSSNEIALATED